MSQGKGQILKDTDTGDPVAMARVLIATPSVNPELEASGAGEASGRDSCLAPTTEADASYRGALRPQ
jgi:hypothetical protein